MVRHTTYRNYRLEISDGTDDRGMLARSVYIELPDQSDKVLKVFSVTTTPMAALAEGRRWVDADIADRQG